MKIWTTFQPFKGQFSRIVCFYLGLGPLPNPVKKKKWAGSSSWCSSWFHFCVSGAYRRWATPWMGWSGRTERFGDFLYFKLLRSWFVFFEDPKPIKTKEGYNNNHSSILKFFTLQIFETMRSSSEFQLQS